MYAYTLRQGRAEKRRHHTRLWIYGSRVGAWLGISAACCESHTLRADQQSTRHIAAASYRTTTTIARPTCRSKWQQVCGPCPRRSGLVLQAQASICRMGNCEGVLGRENETFEPVPRVLFAEMASYNDVETTGSSNLRESQYCVL